MPRPTRIVFPGACYHVCLRAQAALFSDKAHVDYFEDLLTTALERYHGRLYAYCWLPSAYHLLLQTQQANLGQLMRFINGHYAQYLAEQGVRFSPKDRYQAWVFDPEAYLGSMVNLIHQQANRCPGVPDWRQFRWSSVRYYLEKAPAPDALQIDAVKARIAPMPYAVFCEQPLPKAVSTFYQLQRRPAILGGSDFRRWVKGHRQSKVSRSPNEAMQYLARLVGVTADIFQCLPSDLLKLQRGHFNRPRNVAIYLARFDAQIPLGQIASFFGMRSHSAVCNILQTLDKQLAHDAHLADTMIAVRQRLRATQPEMFHD